MAKKVHKMGVLPKLGKKTAGRGLTLKSDMSIPKSGGRKKV
jgi:hypothetical protein